jgi:hypothetical protein
VSERGQGEKEEKVIHCRLYYQGGKKREKRVKRGERRKSNPYRFVLPS